MLRTFFVSFAALAVSSTALAGEAEITLKAAADMANALADADPSGGWVASGAEPEPQAAKAKADILIESLEEMAVIGYDPALLRADPWGASADGAFEIFAIGTIEADPAAANATLRVETSRESATIELPRDTTWADVAAENVGYLVVEGATGAATLVFPWDLVLHGIEPDEID